MVGSYLSHVPWSPLGNTLNHGSYLKSACIPKALRYSAVVSSGAWGAVAALTAFLGATANHGGRMASWVPGKDPCGAANCTTGTPAPPQQYPMGMSGARDADSHNSSCQWEGLTCR